MPSGRRIHRGGTWTLSAAMVVIGLVLIVRVLSLGGGPGALGIVLGVLFVAAGGARIYLLRRS